MKSKSRAKRSNTEPQPSHRRLYQHYRSDSENLRLSISSPLHPRKPTQERKFAEVPFVPETATSSRSKTVALFDHLVGAVAKTGRPAMRTCVSSGSGIA